MSIEKTTLHPENNPDIDLYPKTSVDQVEGLTNNSNVKNGSGIGSIETNYEPDNYGSFNEYCVALGYICEARGIYSVAMGKASKAYSGTCFAFGAESTAGNINSPDEQMGCIAMGQVAKANGRGATAFGYNTTSTGNGSFVCGEQSYATAECTVAMGHSNNNSGARSMVVGSENINQGTNSYVMGHANKCYANNSLIVGYNNLVNTTFSYLLGSNLQSDYANKLVCGYWNSNKSATLFEVGNGSQYARSNAFEVTTSGIARAYGTPNGEYDVIRKRELDALRQELVAMINALKQG